MILAMIMTLENEEQRSFVEELYNKYQQRILNICMKILKNPDDANDALVDTFVRVMENVEKFMEIEEENLYGFLAVSAKNIACDTYRKKTRRSQNEMSSTYFESDDSEGNILDLKDESIDIEQALIDKEFITEVKEMMQSMPSDQSTVLVYKFLYHMGNSEIAELLCIDRSVVNLRLHRARNKLKKLLIDRYSNV